MEVIIMAVLVKDRKISKFEFYMNAVNLRKSVVFFCMRDFGIKPKVRSPTYFFDNTWSNEDKDTITKLFHDHNYDNIEATYPYWLIDFYRDRLITFTNSMVENIVAAYSIFSYTIEEAYLRRNLQDMAIAACYNIKSMFELMVDTIPVNKQIMLELAGKIDKEISLLKGWRKMENKTISKLQKNFPEYAKFKTIEMKNVTQLPTLDNSMVDKAKLEHTIKATDIKMEEDVDKTLFLENKQSTL